MPPTLSPMPRIDYDDIAHLYDEPSRDHTADRNLLTFLEERRTAFGADLRVRVIDIGCGTGKQLAADLEQLPTARLIRIDRFYAMLRIGRTRCPSAVWIQADGPRLPLASRSVDYATEPVFLSPHPASRELAAEVFRVLKAGGRFVMTNIDPWSMPGWLVYRYFPEAEELDRQDFMPTERFVAVMGD